MEDGEIDEGMVVEESSQSPAPSRKPEKSPYDMLKKSKASVEEIVAKSLSIKNENKPKSELREHVTQMFLHLVTLRQANHSILLEEDKVKTETERAKAPVDFTTLQLHNLMYEKSHYLKAIKTCKDFKSKYPDIELVPEEEFFRDSPEEIKGSNLSDDSSHNLMLRRLNFELFQRKELCKLLEKLEQRKKSLLETIANRKKFLSSLPSHLKSLKKASLPVQNQLGVLHTKKLKQHHSAELLPPPLYVIYSQFMAQKETFGEDIDLEIIGSMKDAQAFACQQANKDNGSTEGPEYNILCNLFPDDTGLDLPHQSAKLFVGDVATFDQKRPSRPYKWAQHLAGIDFLPEVSPLLKSQGTSNNEAKSDAVISGLALYRQQNRVQTVVQRIRSRKKAELALVLHSWSSVGSKVYEASSQSVTDTEPVQEPMDVDMDGRSGTLKEELEGLREDGELPSLLAVPAVTNDTKLPPLKGSSLNHSKQLALISKSILSPVNEENCTLSHQVYCLAMFFDYYMDEATPCSEKRKSCSVIDVGLCKPVSGRLLARSFRGRDLRKMISWKDMECSTGYPF
ncbi:hypothetical protein REPUB_Repub19eG0045000 [Reevesia pubescens]